MKRVRFHPEAETEMVQAAIHYKAQEPKLVSRFLVSVQDAISRIQISPLLYQLVEGGARRRMTRTFPFGVVYRDGVDAIEIIAVMHMHREPGYWRSRTHDPGQG